MSGSASLVHAQSQTEAPRAQCSTRLVDAEPLELRLLVDDDQVDVVPAAEAVIGDREQTVRIRRQVIRATVPFFESTTSIKPGP